MTGSGSGVRTRAFLQTKLPTPSSSGSSKQGSYQVAEAAASSSSSSSSSSSVHHHASSHHPSQSRGQHLHSPELPSSPSATLLRRSTSPSSPSKFSRPGGMTTTPPRSMSAGDEAAVDVEEIEEDDEEEVDLEGKEEEEQESDRLAVPDDGSHEGLSGGSVGVWMGLGRRRYVTPSLTSSSSHVLSFPSLTYHMSPVVPSQTSCATTQLPADSSDDVAYNHMIAQATAVGTEDVKEDQGVVKTSRKGGGPSSKPSKGTKKIATSTPLSPSSSRTTSLMSKGGISGGKEKEGP